MVENVRCYNVTNVRRRARRSLPPFNDVTFVTFLTIRCEAKPQYFRRMLLGKMFNSVRYLATVRRATGTPRWHRIWTISWSLNGACPSSFLMRSKIVSFTLVLLIDSPVAV